MAPSPPFMVKHPNRFYLPQSAGKRKGAVDGPPRLIPITASNKGRKTVFQGSFKATLRKRFFAKRNGRNAICLSPKGEFMALQ
jgi:hypothetical protein